MLAHVWLNALSCHIPIYQTFSNELNTLDHFLASASSSSTPTPNICKIVTRGPLYIEILYSTRSLQQNLYLNVCNKTVRHCVSLSTYSSLHSLLIPYMIAYFFHNVIAHLRSRTFSIKTWKISKIISYKINSLSHQRQHINLLYRAYYPHFSGVVENKFYILKLQFIFYTISI